MYVAPYVATRQTTYRGGISHLKEVAIDTHPPLLDTIVDVRLPEMYYIVPSSSTGLLSAAENQQHQNVLQSSIALSAINLRLLRHPDKLVRFRCRYQHLPQLFTINVQRIESTHLWTSIIPRLNTLSFHSGLGFNQLHVGLKLSVLSPLLTTNLSRTTQIEYTTCVIFICRKEKLS